MTTQDKIKAYCENEIESFHDLLATLVAIPAPSHHEEKRAQFCKEWLEKQGAEGVYIDEAKNCVYPIACEGKDDIVVFMAHTDTVFPDTDPFEMTSDGKRFYAPGVGDDTACLAAMLTVTKYLIHHDVKPKCGILIVANSGEEGLGNLKGSGQIMRDYQGRIKRFYTFDGYYTHVICGCVGSHRYEVECLTEGGHSFSAFGKANAIAELAELISDLYRIEIPEKPGTKTTYNVGTIEGGTSVNTIAQQAKMLYEYRSDDLDCLEYMKQQFTKALERANAKGTARFQANILGVRPCSGKVDPKEHEQMIARSISISEAHSGIPCHREVGSTDCNIPMSMGVPSVCVGTYTGGGTHTREEYVDIASLPIGLRICFDIMLDYFEP
ncbi:MAG: M20/M25/M40 family metallo-hydrolase [Clostridia bacterium]|nr:M20/M25/M40 family metallo-hydrolase [Clostridia bacterium]